MYYVIQENIFKEVHHALLIEMMEKFDFPHEVVKLEKFEDHFIIHFTTDRKDIFCFGAVAMAHQANKYGWTPGSMMNANHDFEVYSKGFGLENMLNGDSQLMKFTGVVPIDDYLFFARPTKDTKLFTGQVFTHESYYEYVAKRKELSTYINLDEADIIVAPCKEIQQEVRCWVVGGKVVTASRYRLGRQTIYKNYDNEDFYINFAQQMVDKYQPAEAFVIDVCLANDELKIVEVNCINCAGFYHADMYKLISSLENHFSNEKFR